MLRFTRRAALHSVLVAAGLALLASCSDRDSTGPNSDPLFKTGTHETDQTLLKSLIVFACVKPT